MDQEAANYFTTDSTFNVPVILSTENLNSFVEATVDESNEVPTIQLQNDVNSQEDASSQSEHPSALLMDNEPSVADEPPVADEPLLDDNEPSFEDNEISFQDNLPDELENDISQTQNLKVLTSIEINETYRIQFFFYNIKIYNKCNFINI